MEEHYAIEYIRKKLIPIIVGYYCDVYQNTDQREAMTFLVNKTLKKIDQFGKNGKIECIVYQIKTNEDDIHELRISKNFNGELLVWNKRWGTSYKVN